MFFNLNDVLYLIPLITIILYYFKEYPYYTGTLLATLFLKILFAIIMLNLILYRYDYGDLHTYFDRAVERSQNFTLDKYYFQGTQLIGSLNAIIFYVLGPSYFGISIIMAILAHYSLARIVFLFSQELNSSIRLTRISLLALNLFPFIGLQSTYIGKDPWVLFLLSLVVSRLNMRNKDIIPLGIICGLIFVIRPYQGILTGLILFVIYFSTKKWLTTKTAVVTIGTLFFATAAFTYFFENLSRILVDGLIEFLAYSYKDGNLVREPYPQPITFLQLFRPFPWDGGGIIAFLSSIENLIFLYFFIVMIPTHLSNLKKLNSTKVSVQSKFATLSILVFFLLFMYSENLGDLSRRHIYFYPFIFLVYFFEKQRFWVLKIQQNIKV